MFRLISKPPKPLFFSLSFLYKSSKKTPLFNKSPPNAANPSAFKAFSPDKDYFNSANTPAKPTEELSEYLSVSSAMKKSPFEPKTKEKSQVEEKPEKKQKKYKKYKKSEENVQKTSEENVQKNEPLQKKPVIFQGSAQKPTQIKSEESPKGIKKGTEAKEELGEKIEENVKIEKKPEKMFFQSDKAPKEKAPKVFKEQIPEEKYEEEDNEETKKPFRKFEKAEKPRVFSKFQAKKDSKVTEEEQIPEENFEEEDNEETNKPEKPVKKFAKAEKPGVFSKFEDKKDKAPRMFDFSAKTAEKVEEDVVDVAQKPSDHKPMVENLGFLQRGVFLGAKLEKQSEEIPLTTTTIRNAPVEFSRICQELEKDMENAQKIKEFIDFLKSLSGEEIISCKNIKESRGFFRSLLENSERKDTLFVEFAKILGQKGLFSSKTIRSVDLSRFCLQKIKQNPYKIGLYLELLTEFQGQKFLANFQKLCDQQIYQLCSTKLMDFNRVYLGIKRKILDSSSPSENGLGALYHILDYSTNQQEFLEIYLDAYTNLSNFKKSESFSSDFIVKALLKNLDVLLASSETSKKPGETAKTLLKDLPDIDQNRLYMVKALIFEKNYKAARECFFFEVLRKEIAESYRVKVRGFLEAMLNSQTKDIVIPPYEYEKAKKHIVDFSATVSEEVLCKIFKEEHRDLAVLNLFPKQDWENFTREQQIFQVFEQLFEKNNGNLEAIAQEIKADADNNEIYREISKHLKELAKKHEKEVARVAAKRAKIMAELNEEYQKDLDLGKETLKQKKKLTSEVEDFKEEGVEMATDSVHPEGKEDFEAKGEDKEEDQEDNQKTEEKPFDPEKDIEIKSDYNLDFHGVPKVNNRIMAKFVEEFAANPYKQISSNPKIEEEMAYYYCKMKQENFLSNKNEIMELLNRIKNDDVRKVNESKIGGITQRNMSIFKSIRHTNHVSKEKKNILWELLAWGIAKQEPFAVYLTEKGCDVLKIRIPDALARQVELFLDYSTDLSEEMKQKFKEARENVEMVDRGNVYSDHLQSNFVGMPEDFFNSMASLRKDVRYRAFAERKEIEFPMLVSQKFGFLPRWYRNYKKDHDNISNY